jgi:hypothetical protein
MSSPLYVKLFIQFKEITDAARSAVSRHILPLLEGVRVSAENDKKLVELYDEWQAGCRASAAALNRDLYPNEKITMPKMPLDDDDHRPCRQMAAVLIERAVYDEHVAGKWFDTAAENIKKNPNCANHVKTCACKMALEGWTYPSNKMQAQLLKAFYDANYDEEKDEGYVAEIRSIAKARGITFEEEMEGWRRQRAHNKAMLAKDAAKQYFMKAKEAQWQKMNNQGFVFICYQDLNQADLEEYKLHGWYKVTKTAECYEFMLMETSFQDPEWRQAVFEKKVTKVPLTKMMGVGNTSFQNVTPDKIHMG